MQLISNTLQQWARTVKEEIQQDEGKNEWFWPKSSEHQIFEQADMKFVNRNLNYFYFESMIAQVREGNEFNKALPRTLEFCRSVRQLAPKYAKAPFGRMCVWKLSPGMRILPHKDDYKYHRFVMRNIFVVSEDDICKDVCIRINNEEVEVKQGVLFQFSPSGELHEFHNKGDKPFYFLGFDFWEAPLLQVLQTMIDYDAIVDDPGRLDGFGGPNTKFKYISQH
jgi:hypothetical protein